MQGSSSRSQTSINWFVVIRPEPTGTAPNAVHYEAKSAFSKAMWHNSARVNHSKGTERHRPDKLKAEFRHVQLPSLSRYLYSASVIAFSIILRDFSLPLKLHAAADPRKVPSRDKAAYCVLHIPERSISRIIWLVVCLLWDEFCTSRLSEAD